MNDIFKTVLQRCGLFLRRLDVSSMHMNNYILNCIGNFCPNLQFIEMGSAKLTLMAVKKWTKNVHNLTEIAFGNCTKYCNDTHLSNFFLQNKQLQSLKIISNNVLTGKCLLSLPVNMKAIVIDRCPNILFNQLNNALELHCDQLETLSLTKSYHAQFSKDVHSMPTTLKIVEIRWCTVFNIDCIIQMKNLEKLVLND